MRLRKIGGGYSPSHHQKGGQALTCSPTPLSLGKGVIRRKGVIPRG